jgi:recombinational DNA repair protein (RecF pathway)
MMVFPRMSDEAFSKLFLFILRLVVYSKSSLLTMTFLSLYGLIHGVARVPRKRASAVKSLLRYGVNVIQHGLGSSTQV